VDVDAERGCRRVIAEPALLATEFREIQAKPADMMSALRGLSLIRVT
jgi:hypothetical protein